MAREAEPFVPDVILAIDPLHAAVAAHSWPGVPWVLYLTGEKLGRPQCVSSAAVLPGIFEVTAGGAQHAALVICDGGLTKRHAQRWDIDVLRIIGADCDDTDRFFALLSEVIGSPSPTVEFNWWIDLWRLGSVGQLHRAVRRPHTDAGALRRAVLG